MTAAKVSRIPARPPRKRAPAKKAPPAVAARQAEAEDGFLILEQCGVTVRVPTAGKVPVAAIDAFRNGDSYEGTKQMLGKEQWQLLSDAGMTGDDLAELGKKLDEAQGN